MLVGGQCPVCGGEIHPPEFQSTLEPMHLCKSCGWYESRQEMKVEEAQEKKTIWTMSAVAAALVIVSAHMISWGGGALEILPLKLQQWTGTLSSTGYYRIADLCLANGRAECARKAYLDSYLSAKDLEGLPKLATLQLAMKETQSAMTTLNTYFARGGKSPEAALSQGQLLEQSGRLDEALQMFELAIKSMAEQMPDRLPIAMTGAMVRVLMKQGKFEEAYKVVREFHGSAGNAQGYLNTELAQIEQVLKKAGSPVVIGRKTSARGSI